ncbi:MAG: hypothetical protein EP344_15045 [Bacteroidetes bacterium]|nr:MAG: hypothetical protein EP344_15045 [Bacteroidota bacterium]
MKIPCKQYIAGLLCLLFLASLSAQQPDTLDWNKLDFTKPHFKGVLAKKGRTWPYIVGGAVLTGGIVYWVTRDGDDQPEISLRNDAITLTCAGTGSLNVLANDTGKGLTIQSIGSTTGATVEHKGSGLLQFSNIGTGSFSFTYTATDQAGQSATATVTVTVLLPALTIMNDDLAGTDGQVISGNLLANDVGTGLFISDFSQPATGNLEVSNNGAFTFTPSACANAAFTYTVGDACLQTATGTVTLEITDITPPVINCPVPVTIACNEQPDPNTTGNPQVQDFCDPQPVVGYTDEPGGTTCNQSITRTWTTTDATGNQNSCIQVITRIDNIPPAWTICPIDITLDCGQQDNLDLTGTGMLTDACSGVVTAEYTDDLSGLNACSGTIIRTWTGIDPCGNNAPACIQQITIVPADCAFDPGIVIVPANCAQTDGSIALFLTPPGNYQFTWMDGSAGTTLLNLAPGTYTVTIHDPDNYCTQIFPVQVPEIPPVYIDNAQIEAPSCITPGNVILDLNASGNSSYDVLVTGPVDINISGLQAGTLNLGDYAVLDPGMYTVTVNNIAGCAETLTATIPPVPPFTMNVVNITEPGCPVCSDGSIAVQINGAGGFPLQVFVNGSPGGQSNNYFIELTGLAVGTYTIQVISDNGAGCITDPVTVMLTFSGFNRNSGNAPILYTGPVSLPDPVLTGRMAAIIASLLPEHPQNGPAETALNTVFPLAQTGLSWQSNRQGIWTWQVVQFSGSIQARYTDDLEVHTPVQGFSQQLSWKQAMFTHAGITPYFEIGGGWEQIRSHTSWAGDKGYWNPVSTQAKQDTYQGFLGGGIQVRLNNKKANFDLRHRLRLLPASAGAENYNWIPFFEGGFRTSF